MTITKLAAEVEAALRILNPERKAVIDKSPSAYAGKAPDKSIRPHGPELRARESTS